MGALLKEYYEISGRNTDAVSAKYKALHVTLFIISALAGLVTFVAFSITLGHFNNVCILNADVVFVNESVTENPVVTITAIITTTDNVEKELGQNVTSKDTEGDKNESENESIVNKTKIIDQSETDWGSDHTCFFCQFTPVVSMICSIIWTVFFCIMIRGGNGYESDLLGSPWKIVYPCIFFSAVFSVVLISSAIVMSNGMTKFCKELNPENKGCSKMTDWYTLQFHDSKQDFFMFYNIALTSAYVGFVAWLAQIALLIYRVLFMVDFNIHFVHVFEKDEIVCGEVACVDEETARSVTEDDGGNSTDLTSL